LEKDGRYKNPANQSNPTDPALPKGSPEYLPILGGSRQIFFDGFHGNVKPRQAQVETAIRKKLSPVWETARFGVLFSAISKRFRENDEQSSISFSQ